MKHLDITTFRSVNDLSARLVVPKSCAAMLATQGLSYSLWLAIIAICSNSAQSSGPTTYMALGLGGLVCLILAIFMLVFSLRILGTVASSNVLVDERPDPNKQKSKLYGLFLSTVPLAAMVLALQTDNRLALNMCLFTFFLHAFAFLFAQAISSQLTALMDDYAGKTATAV